MLGGMAMRMAYALQLHRELDHDPLGRKKDKSSELSCTDREIRRRTMWACFLMDRFNSSGTERPMFANEESINVQLPIREAHFQMEIPGATEFLNGRIKNPTSADTGQISDPRENMGVAAYLIKIIALWGRVIKYLNLGGTHNDPHPFWHPKSQYADLKRQAEDYMESLPKRMRYSPETLENFAAQRLANQFLYMHIAYNQVVLFLHKFAIPTTPGGKVPPDMPNDFVSQAAKMAVDAASKISVLLNETTNHLVAAPFVGYCAFASSTVHIWGIFSKNAQLEASSKRNLAYNVKYLSVMKKHWGMLHYMAENLKGIYRQHADAALGGGASGKADTNTIFQYGDWFDKYPHGVSGADYEDPAVPAESETGNATSLTSKSDLQSVEDFFHTLSPPASSNQRKAPRKQSQMSGRAESTQAPNTNIKNIKNEPRSHAPHIQSHQQQLLGIPSQHVHHQQASGVLDPALQQPTYNPYNSSFSQQAQGYPVGLFPPNQPLSVHKLDRHFVFGAYAQDPSASGLYHTGNDVMSSQPHDASQNPNQTNQALNSMLWDQSVDFSLAGLNGGGHPGAFADAVGSAAWFMPFNLAPPDVGNPDGDIGGFTGSPTAGMGEGRVYGEIQDLGQ